MQQHGNKYFARRPLPPPQMSKGHNPTFSKQCPVAYQIMEQHGSKYFVRPPPPLRPWGLKAKIHLFQNMVLLHIKSKGMANAATW